MGFMMDGLEAEAYDRHYRDGVLIKRIFRYFQPKLPVILIVAVIIVLGSSMDAVLPLFIAQSIDSTTASITTETTLFWVAAILFSGVLGWVFNYLRRRYTAQVVGKVVADLREDAFLALMRQDMSFFDRESSGKIASRVTADTEGFASVVILILDLISQLILLFVILGVLILINMQLALIALLIIPAIMVAALSFRKIARRFTQRALRARARINASVQETMSGIAVAKAFRQERIVYNEFAGINNQVFRVNLQQGLLFSGIYPVLNILAGLGMTLMVYYGGTRVLSHHISAGEWFLFIESIGVFWFPLTTIASFWSQFQQGLSASERVFALIDVEPSVQQNDNCPVRNLHGQITFNNLTFRYTDQETVLDNFNLTIHAGETVALVGHTGAGKSTLGKLIARFYEFQQGQLLIDGHDIRSFNLADYRRQIGIVPQVPFLFSGTIAENIRYARPDATNVEVSAVVHQIGGDWLEMFPQGLQTQVGEMGIQLSMGQRQFVALARVLLQDPSIVILDEATASVDLLTEAQIQETLNLVLAHRTAIVIAHRLSTVRHVDRVLVLDRGRIVEEGNHDVLMQRGGYYAHLYNTYFRHQAPDYIPGKGFMPTDAPGNLA
jgi:ABC-type multidrug transport system fused ATPase/permease subunit